MEQAKGNWTVLVALAKFIKWLLFIKSVQRGVPAGPWACLYAVTVPG